MQKIAKHKIALFIIIFSITLLLIILAIFRIIPASGASFRMYESFSEQSLVPVKRITAETIMTPKTQLDLGFSVLIADLTNIEVIASSNILAPQQPLEMLEQMIILTALSYGEPEKELILTAEDVARLGEKDSLFEGDAGDVFTLENFLTYYIMSRNTACKTIIAKIVAQTELDFIALMNQLAKRLKTANTKYISLSGESIENQYTTVYDIYLISHELLKYEAFINSIQNSSLEIRYTDGNGQVKFFHAEHQVSDEEFLFMQERSLLPQGYTLLDEITSTDEMEGSSHLEFIRDPQGNYLLMILMGVPSGKSMFNVASEVTGILKGNTSVNSLSTDGESEIPEEAYIPIDSNESRYQYLFGSSVATYTIDNPPKGYENNSNAKKNMTTFQVPVWKMNTDGSKYAAKYEISINKKLEASVKCIFQEIYDLELQFPIKYLIGYNYRKVGAVGLRNLNLMSMHSFGAAIDINPGDYDNDYYLGYGNDLRDRSNPYCIPDEVINIFQKYGWFWGGNFSISSDTMHFQYLGLDYLSYGDQNPFRLLEVASSVMKGEDVYNLQQRLAELNYSTNRDGKYTLETEAAIRQFQGEHEIEETGVTDYKTWETIINLTHYMSYVF